MVSKLSVKLMGPLDRAGSMRSRSTSHGIETAVNQRTIGTDLNALASNHSNWLYKIQIFGSKCAYCALRLS